MGNERENDLPVDLPGPARRALSGAGYVRLGQLTTISEADVSRLHGVGPRAVDRLRRALDANGQSFAGEGLGTMPREQTSNEEENLGDAGITRTTQDAPTAGRGRFLNILLWVLQVLLALQFVIAGLVKVIGDPTMVEMFVTIGIGQWFRHLVGVLEIAGAVGVLIPRLSGLAALGLVCLMVGATLTNLFVLDASPLLTIVLLLVSAFVAWGRWPRTGALAGGTGR